VAADSLPMEQSSARRALQLPRQRRQSVIL
jgi:hypothetical protein